ncbi:styrene monooxygenase/indole monooxygenase family protein [Photobacterium minamisatsumaniensis]|uniref:styrene monooxygenase/indole monooxygenase family protein n=1 Tax=Photobacterium minamisatsumaniensis TaxID=2910233 RepID=UPI003D0C3B63
MRKITIIGAGQAGLQLGIGLLQHGYHVKLVTDKQPKEIEHGYVMSTQCMFHSALNAERQLKLDNWQDTCPEIRSINLCITAPDAPGSKAIEWQGELEHIAQSVDQRIKFPAWMTLFTQQGGLLEFKQITEHELDDYAAESDLVIVASGKGEIGQLFKTDDSRTNFTQPQRSLSLLYVSHPDQDCQLSKVSFNVIPGVGEYFVMPVLSRSGPCEAMLFEAIPGSPMDCFKPDDSPEQRLTTAKQLLQHYLPWEAERVNAVTLTDAKAVIHGQLTPTVRHPTAILPSGSTVLGLADAVCLNDPITGQGSNNAAKAAQVYLSRILERGDKPFDTQWMTDTFDQSWQHAQWATRWTNMMLTPPPEFVLNLLGAASQHQVLADRIANAFDDPQDLFPWFADEQEASRYLASLAATS